MNDALLNPRTAAKLENYAANPAQALLLVGPSGSGKLDVARSVAAKLLGLKFEKLDSYAHFWTLEVPEGKKEIPVESVRDLTKRLTLQVPGRAAVRRVVIIKDADLMTHQAQNAFLKSLEEPAPGTVFILTAASASSLLETITSRTATISVDPVDLKTAKMHFKDYSDKEVTAAWTLSQGAVGLLRSLLKDDDNELKKSVELAKAFLGKTTYERLIMLEGLKDKQELADFLIGLSKVLKALYRASADRRDNRRTKVLLKAFGIVADTQEGLEANVLPRLLVLKLVLNLSL